MCPKSCRALSLSPSVPHSHWPAGHNDPSAKLHSSVSFSDCLSVYMSICPLRAWHDKTRILLFLPIFPLFPSFSDCLHHFFAVPNVSKGSANFPKTTTRHGGASFCLQRSRFTDTARILRSRWRPNVQTSTLSIIIPLNS